MNEKETMGLLGGLELAIDYCESRIEVYEKQGQFLMGQIADVRARLDDLRSRLKKLKKACEA